MSEHSNLTRGTRNKIATTPIEDGKIRFCTDEGRLYIDYHDQRIEVSDVITDKTAEELAVLQNPLNKLYLASDTKAIYYPCHVGTVTMLRQITGDTYISDVQEGTTSYSKVYNFYLTYAYNDMSAIIAIEIPTLTYIDEKATGIGVETVGTNKGQAYYTTFDRSLGQNVSHVVANFGKNLDISENATIKDLQNQIDDRVLSVDINSTGDYAGEAYMMRYSGGELWKEYIINLGKYLNISANTYLSKHASILARVMQVGIETSGDNAGKVYLLYDNNDGTLRKDYIADLGEYLDISENSDIKSLQTAIGKRVYDIGVESNTSDSNYGKAYYECQNWAGVWKKYYVSDFGKYLDISENPSIKNLQLELGNLDQKIRELEQQYTQLDHRVTDLEGKVH